MRLASVSKPVAALAVLVAAEEGVVDLDEPAGPPGSTVRHLLAHTSGLPFEGTTPIAPPGRRRIYSNEAFRVLGAHLAERAEMPFADYVRAAVCEPLGIGLDPSGDPGSGHARLARRRARDRPRAARARRLVAEETRDEMTRVQFPGLSGVLPGLRPLRSARLGPRRAAQHAARRRGWGRGPRRARSATSAGSGTFLWVDPEARRRLRRAHDREFGDWAKAAWPVLSDAVLERASPPSRRRRAAGRARRTSPRRSSRRRTASSR